MISPQIAILTSLTKMKTIGVEGTQSPRIAIDKCGDCEFYAMGIKYCQ